MKTTINPYIRFCLSALLREALFEVFDRSGAHSYRNEEEGGKTGGKGGGVLQHVVVDG